MIAAATIAATASCTGVPDAGPQGTAVAPLVENTSALLPVEPFSIMTKTAADDPRRFEEARLIVEAFRAAGMPARLEAVDSAELSNRGFASKNFDIYLIAYDPTLERLDPNDFLSRFWSGNASSDGSNLSGYQNEQFDDLYLAQLRAEESEQRLELVRKAERILYEQQPAAPYVHQTIASAYNSAFWAGAVTGLGNPVYHIWNSLQMKPVGDRRRLVVGVTSEAQTLNPVTAATSESGLPLSHIYDSLVRIGPDGEPVNWGASNIEVNGPNVEVMIREGMRFHDGEPVTAEDVAFTLEYLIENEAPLYAAKLDIVKSVTVSGSAVAIELAAPSAAFVPTALATMPILPRHIWKDVEPANFPNHRPVGSGPFAFESRKLGATLTLRSNPDHFAAPEADGIVWATFGSIDAEIGALRQGEIDILGDFLSSSQLSSLEGVQGVTIQEEASHGWNGLHFNMRREPFNDLHFRRALAALIPVEDIQEIVLEGGGEPGGSVLAPQLSWHNLELGPFPRGVARAKAELEKAGYVTDSDGTLYYPPKERDERVLQAAP